MSYEIGGGWVALVLRGGGGERQRAELLQMEPGVSRACTRGAAASTLLGGGVYTLVEPCAGSAAFALHMLGARRALLPYQGSKWRFRLSLAEHARGLGFRGAPSRVLLTDPGGWGVTLGVVLDEAKRHDLMALLTGLASRDAREVYGELHGGKCPANGVKYAAEFLFLQRLAFSGKAVGTRKGRWVSPGFNTSSAYGLAATDRFGEVKPMVPSMIRVLRSYSGGLASAVADVHHTHATKPPKRLGAPTLVYLDPPYSGSTGYPDGSMSRPQVVALARAWKDAGASVIVSEQSSLPLPGWGRAQLYSGRSDTSPFRGKQEEWVTFA